MSSKSGSSKIHKGVGLLVFEVVNSNPNGDPQNGGSPRVRMNNIGEMSPQSLKRKIRDIVSNKDGELWKHFAQLLSLDAAQYRIMEERTVSDEEIEGEMKKGSFAKSYYDGRLFGSGLFQLKKKLKEKLKGKDFDMGKIEMTKTGVVVVETGTSIAPVEISESTITSKRAVQDDKPSGMGPAGYKYVQHGVYVMPFTVSPSAAIASGCTEDDVKLFLALLPYVFDHTKSSVRPSVRMRHCWYAEHKPTSTGFHIGSCPDYRILDALMPKRKGDDPMLPSTSWEDYDCPNDISQEIKGKLHSFKDLLEQ